MAKDGTNSVRVKSRRVSAAERVTAKLRLAILRGELLPGDHIRQEMWADRLRVSRLPIREALKVLASEGLCEHDPHRGYFVAKLDVTELSQIYWMRRMLEPELIRTMRWPTEAELQGLREHARTAEDSLRSEDIARAMDAERSFDYRIFDFSSLNIVAREVKRLWALLDPYRFLIFSHPDALRRITDRHEAFLSALVRQDREALTKVVLDTQERMISDFTCGPFISADATVS